MRKAAALWYFMEDRSRLHVLRPPDNRFPKGIDTDERIIENLKMEIQMMVFHSAESLFMTVLGHYYIPALPWFWMTTCDQHKTNIIMNLWKEKGIEAIIEDSEKWLRCALYPTVDESHEKYKDSKVSAKFAKDYLDRLARHYMYHKEYNEYKHGLNVFPTPGSFSVVDEDTGKTVLGTQGDFLQFLNCKHQPNQQYEYRIRLFAKKYNLKVDMGILSVNSWLMMNLLEDKRVKLTTPEGQKGVSSRVYFVGFDVDEIFGSGRFSISV